MSINDINDMIYDTRKLVSDFLEDGAPQISSTRFRQLEDLEKALSDYQRYVR